MRRSGRTAIALLQSPALSEENGFFEKPLFSLSLSTAAHGFCMELSVMLVRLPHIARACAAAACLLCTAVSSAAAAKLEWTQQDGRERITISMDEREGMAGRVGRIAPNGVLIPYTEVPPGLVVSEPPEKASIFKATRILGRALAIETQTAEFGFVVTKQTPTELVVDFFPNPLGARWKPTEEAPTTEPAPDLGLPEFAERTRAIDVLDKDPEGRSADTTDLLAEATPPAEAPPALPVTGQPEAAPPAPVTGQPEPPTEASPLSQPAVAASAGSAETPGGSAPATPETQPESIPPAAEPSPASGAARSVPVLTGSPLYAATATQMSEAPPATPASALDSRQQTAHSTPLPQFEPPASPAGAPAARPETPPQAEAPAASVPANTAPPAVVVLPSPGVAAGGATALPPQTPAAPAASPATAPVSPATVAAQPSGDTGTPPVAVPAAHNTPQSAAANPNGVGPVFRSAMDPKKPAVGKDGPMEEPAVAPPATGATPVPDTAPGAEAPAEPPQAFDEEGNPIPPPPDVGKLLPQLREMFASAQFAPSLELAELLLAQPDLTREQREELLHIRAEALFGVHKDELEDYFAEISDATNRAISINQSSRRNAGAHLRLGYMNLKLKHLPEARAHFNMLRRLFPDDENVPLTYYYWGDHYFNNNEFQKAADEFQYVLQKYPNSRYARESALGLARTFYSMGYYEQSFNVVDYIEKRWERYYIEYPPFLNMMGDVAFRLDKLEQSRKNYWLYINLQPSGEETDIILTRLGDIYTKMREKDAARELYTTSMNRFPDRDGGLVAMMRLAEESINDEPTLAGMFSVFDGEQAFAPAEVYRTIIQKHPQSPLVPLAKIKLALWHLWNKDYEQTLEQMDAFLKEHPKHELAPRARDIALQTFAVITAESSDGKRSARVREIWERYPMLQQQSGVMSPGTRIALGNSYYQEGKPNEALAMVNPFFLGHKTAEGEMALDLVLTIYLEHEQWRSIREVAHRVELWELQPKRRQQLDYALALTAEQLGESETAVPLWQKLYDAGDLPPTRMTYATYFLAREAERKRELEKAYLLGKEALNRLMTQVERSPNAADVGKIQTQLASLMDVAETAGRLRESLTFAEQYLQYLAEDGMERLAVRYRMARIYKKQGDQETWKKTLAEIAAKAPDSVYGKLAGSELNAASLAEDASQYSPTGRL